MDIQELKRIISSLATSQGAYGRLYNNLDNENKWDELLELCEKNNIKTAVDLVLFIEQ